LIFLPTALYGKSAAMRILLTFTGFHDPFVPSAVEGEMDTGPVLSVAADRPFDHIYLFCTPRLVERTEETRKAILARHKKTEVTILEVPLKDPTNYLGILRQLRTHFSKINAANPGAQYSIAVSSGTPHMHACWILLAASGEIPARILQATPQEFVAEGKSRVKEIDLTQSAFPQITRSLREAPHEVDDDEALMQACRELGIVGQDSSFMRALREAAVYAQYDDVHVLLLGETGCGKEYFAQLIHHLSSRAGRAFVTVNCGSIPENLVESQLFGHKRGAFTGASTDQQGKFKAADGGLIFLDELGELPLSSQAKLLRVLEAGEIEPVGMHKPVKINVKVIAATNRDLKAMVAAGTFRQDLYQRFGSSVNIPSLRQRRTDIVPLALHILNGWNTKHQKQRRLSADALTALCQHPWPGNVRELRKVITQSAMLCSSKSISMDDLRFDDHSMSSQALHLPEPEHGFILTKFLDDAKNKLIDRALEKTNQTQARAAKLLGITPQAVSQHLKARDSKSK
jgi:transcriptional regulator with PAS, ATPase and Fis domain